MASAKRPFRRRSRKATPGALRVLATLVALLLGISSLGQVAHFVLVQHAICAEHGELLEVEAGPARATAPHQHEAAGSKAQPRVSSSELAGHDHCQILARGQKQAGLPPPPALTVVAATATSGACAIAAVTSGATPLSLLSLAPKTSPPLVSHV